MKLSTDVDGYQADKIIIQSDRVDVTPSLFRLLFLRSLDVMPVEDICRYVCSIGNDGLGHIFSKVTISAQAGNRASGWNRIIIVAR
jgi:hypothetical protein